MPTLKKCCLCGSTKSVSILFSYPICQVCKAKINLHKDDTIKKWKTEYKKTKDKPTFADDINYRLSYVEKDYIRKRVKLLHIKKQLKKIK